MKLHRIDKVSRVIGLAALSAGVIAGGFTAYADGAGAQNLPFADAAFQRVWERTDLPVAQGRVNRTWLWGPGGGRSLQESFAESPGGQHLVQYFDKARMEISNPQMNPRDPFYVTNGLLVVEMISGQMQTGANLFDSLGPSDVQIAGDAGSDSPSYGALQGVASVGLPNAEHRAAQVPIGNQLPYLYINRLGSVSSISPASVRATPKAATYVAETGHNIADVFWTYMNSQGPVYENGTYTNGPVINWLTVMGYPVTEPYWTSIKVAGRDRMVLFQAFQRRLLTYSPDNPEGWKVEMGNVGTQYYSWRYDQASIACQRVPLRGFGRVWAAHRTVQRGLGCSLDYPPFNNEMQVQTAWQPFQHGTMLWISRTVYAQERIIYVFFDDGTFQRFDDRWQEGQPVNGGLAPPVGLYEPQRGFGQVWREGTGARVRERLGWATRPEQGSTGAYQQFQRGEMYWTGTSNKIYVLYGTVNNYPYDPTPMPGSGSSPFRYEVFDDTFNP